MNIFLPIQSILYKFCIKPIFFLFPPENVHSFVTRLAEIVPHNLTSILYSQKKTILTQNNFDMTFFSPIGLAAGFDYEARLIHILPLLGFGFHTVGTITYSPYIGNTKPRLGRLPLSKSLMVNKGFKNNGVKKTVKKIRASHPSIPLGISIGKTNNINLTQSESIKDIIKSFKVFEEELTSHSYYELNISCPNLKGSVDFYTPNKLDTLLTALDELSISRPLFVKMPITLTNSQTDRLLHVITNHKIKGVIIGNLQKDRKNNDLNKDELKKFPHGNFSGKPTFKRSNELIEMTYRKYGNKLLVIGCGGVFSAEDAYTKICLGATYIQLITGLIYNGPQLVQQINGDLQKYLEKDGYTNISEAVGSKVKF